MKQRPVRFYSLDVLRGLAALCVVFWHWQHFFYEGTRAGSVTEELPLYKVFFPFYNEGYLAVELFFCLSGFVFYWLYSQPISEATISKREFFLLRFSRLYPLHFATLGLVGIGQLLFYALFHSYYVYDCNDAYHFVLNIFFASSWGLEKGYSFNGPIWSVSVEVFVYALFFACCRLFAVRLGTAAAISLAGFALGAVWYAPIGRGIGSFFLGGCTCLVYQQIVAKGYARRAAICLIPLTVLIWLSAIVTIGEMSGLDSISSVGGLLTSKLGTVVIEFGKAFAKWPQVTLFPSVILVLALVETNRGTLGKRFAFLGDISYSSYLLHFPLQLFVMIPIIFLSIDRSIFLSWSMLLAFFAVLLSISYASYHCFELPSQRFLRQKFLFGPATEHTAQAHLDHRPDEANGQPGILLGPKT